MLLLWFVNQKLLSKNIIYQLLFITYFKLMSVISMYCLNNVKN